MVGVSSILVYLASWGKKVPRYHTNPRKLWTCLAEEGDQPVQYPIGFSLLSFNIFSGDTVSKESDSGAE